MSGNQTRKPAAAPKSLEEEAEYTQQQLMDYFRENDPDKLAEREREEEERDRKMAKTILQMKKEGKLPGNIGELPPKKP